MNFDNNNNLLFKSRSDSLCDMRVMAAGYIDSINLIEIEIKRVTHTKEITNSKLSMLYRIRRQIYDDYVKIINYYR